MNVAELLKQTLETQLAAGVGRSKTVILDFSKDPETKKSSGRPKNISL